MSASTHPIPDAQYEALAYAPGTAEAVEEVAKMDRSVAMADLVGVVALARATKDNELSAPLEQAVGVIGRVQMQSPAVIEAILRSATLGAFLVKAPREQASSAAESYDTFLNHFAYLASFAALAAYLGAYSSETLMVPTSNGKLNIPTLGSLTVSATGLVRVTAERGKISVTDNTKEATIHAASSSENTPGWKPVRHLIAQDGPSLAFEDADPYLDSTFDHVIFRERFSDEVCAAWQELYGPAWEHIQRYTPNYAELIKQRLTTLVPVSELTASSLNMISGDAPGALAMTMPHSSLNFAAHILMGYAKGLLPNMIASHPFFDTAHPEADQPVYTPMHDAPASYQDFLCEAYALAPLLDLYGARYSDLKGGKPKDHAALSFARWHNEVSRSVIMLQKAPHLTPHGRVVLDAMRRKVLHWRQVANALPAEWHDAATTSATDHYISWQLHNTAPDAAAIQSLANAFVHNQEVVALPVSSHVLSNHDILALKGRRDRYVYKEMHVSEYSKWADMPLFNVHNSNIALANGDYETARTGYLLTILSEPNNREAWAGYALTYHHETGPFAQVLQTRPEVAAALYNELRRKGASTIWPPEVVVGWLADINLDPNPT
jgi:HEXXH motif-containing protein